MTETRNSAVAAEIRAEAARRRITGRELARRVARPVTTVNRYMRGETDMSLDDLEVFARALGVTTVDLIARAFNDSAPTPPLGRDTPGSLTNPRLSGHFLTLVTRSRALTPMNQLAA